MRTLKLNKTAVWRVSRTGVEEVKDKDGLFTGEVVQTYSKPSKHFLNLYNVSSEIIQNTFGTSNNITIMCSDEKAKFTIGDRFFYNKPTEQTDIEKEFDLELTALALSLNHTNYGFRSVVK